MQASAIRLAEGVLERIHSEQKISEELENDKKKESYQIALCLTFHIPARPVKFAPRLLIGHCFAQFVFVGCLFVVKQVLLS